MAKHLPREQLDVDGMYATVFALLSPIGYNTNLVKPEDAPKSFADLLDPKWKGKIEIAEYCESDVVNTYRVWLRYEHFRGRLTHAEFLASEAGLVDFIKARGNTKPHLADLT